MVISNVSISNGLQIRGIGKYSFIQFGAPNIPLIYIVPGLVTLAIGVVFLISTILEYGTARILESLM